MAILTFDMEFDKDGAVFDAAQLAALTAGLEPFSDLLVLSHGWNNDKAEATALYEELLGNADRLLRLREESSVPETLRQFTDRLRGRTFAALRIYWPSKKFADADLIPGGGAATTQAEKDNFDAVERVLDELKVDPQRLGDRTVDPVRHAAMEQAKALLPNLATASAQKDFVDLLRSMMDPAAAEKDDASEDFLSVAPETLFANAAMPVMAPGGGAGGGSAGMPDGTATSVLGDLLSGVQAAARRIANYTTYYQMKSRAGAVGSTGVADMLKQIRLHKPTLRIHLVGHSFGGRLVTAAANALPANTAAVSMTLLQAAFSHNGLSGGFGDTRKKGFFRAIIDEQRISGPIVITHTKNDKAVGIAYPLASRIAGQNAAALGDQNDPYGGMGRNGAQHTDEADNVATMGLPGTSYAFKPGRIHNISSDTITGHSDVTRIEVAYALLSAVGAVE